MVRVWQQAVAEFIGTFAVVFVGAGSMVTFNLFQPATGANMVGIALAYGLVIGAMVSAVGHISGGHFNPAVTVGAWIAGKIETARVVVYVVMQLLGGIAGALLLRTALPGAVWERSNLGTPAFDGRVITNVRALLIEGVLTFFLVFVIFAVAVDDRGAFSKIAGLPIGLMAAVGVLMGGLFTGAAMNPARHLGPALLGGGTSWGSAWVYYIGPLAGGVLAAVVYYFVFLRSREVTLSRDRQLIGGGPEHD